MSDKPERRWYQFGLRTLLAFVFVLAVASAWYGYRLRVIEQERSRLAGKWYARWGTAPLLIEPNPAFDVNDKEVDIYMPYGGMGRIDFQMGDGSGVSRGIYRWDGDTITVAQANPNQLRPTSFEKADGISIWTGVRKTP